MINKQKRNKSNGVTLIALIITIIVMLIIAGVALSMINADEGGLFSKSKNAVSKYNNEVEKEANTMDDIMSMLIDTSKIEYSINPKHATTGNVTITLAEIEGYITEYKIGEEWIEYSSEIIIDENKPIYVRLKDSKGRIGSTKTINITNIDRTKPKEFDLEVTSTMNSVTISGKVEDEGDNPSGIRGYQYKLCDSEGNIIEDWTKETNQASYTFNELEAGTTYKVSMKAIDFAGNEREATNANESIDTQEGATNSEKADGSYDEIGKVNSPDTSKLPKETTKYVTWKKTDTETYEEKLANKIPSNWHDYSNGKWANIKSTANELEANWVWIPRFAYKLPESATAKEIEVVFIKGTGTTGVNGEKCYYATDTEITTDGNGLYVNATELAKGTETGKEQAWIVHPAFWWDNDSDGVIDEGEQLAGIWVGKYESSSSTPTATDGGGNVTNLQVQIKPNVSSWRSIQVANMFTVCENIKKTGGVIGNNSNGIDTHMMKNMEWGAIAILSQSKYGIFNPQSLVGVNGDKTYKVWNNPRQVTGQAGSKEDAYIKDTITNQYNNGNGPKASTTGTVYGVYDMAGGTYEYVMGLMEPSTTKGEPAVGSSSTSNTGFTGKLYDGQAYTGVRSLPDSKYYDLYAYRTSEIDYTRGKIGDATVELKPEASSGTTWNSDCAYFVRFGGTVFVRDYYCSHTTYAGVFAFYFDNGSANGQHSFRAVVLVP